MRIGYNPNKDKLNKNHNFYHQVIMPVFIPNFTGYYKDSFKILKVCLESLFKTVHTKTYITIVNNGSCNEVIEYLNILFNKKKINELIHCNNIGKLNAIIKATVGHKFELITIVDSDVLFLNYWQEATYSVFEAFSKAGAVSTTPSSRSLFTHTQNIWFDMFFSNKMKFSNVKNSEALQMFANSIGNKNFYSSVQLKKYLTVEKKHNKAVVGAGHFMATYKSDIFREINETYSEYSLGGNSETKLLDLPVIKKDYWRLSTLDNYTYHLGNKTEDWMLRSLNEIKRINEYIEKPPLKLHKKNIVIDFFKNKLFKKIFFRKKIRFFLMKRKGLNKEEVLNYKS